MPNYFNAHGRGPTIILTIAIPYEVRVLCYQIVGSTSLDSALTKYDSRCSRGAVTVATTLAPLPVNNNNTAALAGEHTSVDKRDQITASSVHESSSKEIAVDQVDEGGNEKEPQPATRKMSIRFFAIIAALACPGC